MENYSNLLGFLAENLLDLCRKLDLPLPKIEKINFSVRPCLSYTIFQIIWLYLTIKWIDRLKLMEIQMIVSLVLRTFWLYLDHLDRLTIYVVFQMTPFCRIIPKRLATVFIKLSSHFSIVLLLFHGNVRKGISFSIGITIKSCACIYKIIIHFYNPISLLLWNNYEFLCVLSVCVFVL